jgi:hypothetical protein
VILIRSAGLFFAFVQITLLLRLALPFVDEVPEGLEEYIPALMNTTDLWIAPVLAVVDRFELSGISEGIVEAGTQAVTGPEEFEPIVLVAMVGWALAAWFALFVLRLIFRPAG